MVLNSEPSFLRVAGAQVGVWHTFCCQFARRLVRGLTLFCHFCVFFVAVPHQNIWFWRAEDREGTEGLAQRRRGAQRPSCQKKGAERWEGWTAGQVRNPEKLKATGAPQKAAKETKI